MKRWVLILLAFMVAAVLPGCYDRLEVENVAFALALGIDLDQNGNLVVYETSPVFSKEAREKKADFEVKSRTLLQARTKFDAGTIGSFVGGKVQTIVLSRRVLQHKNWFHLLDIFYRNPKLTVNAKVVAVDGPVEEILKSNPPDKPRISVALPTLIDTSEQRAETVKTTLQELHRQMLDKGITPVLPEIKRGPELVLAGTALLDKKGKYVTTLKEEENMLLRILQNKAKGELSLNISVPGERNNGEPGQEPYLGFLAQNVKTDVKTAYAGGKFTFNFRIKMHMVVWERLFPFEMRKQGEDLERMVEEQLNARFKQVIGIIQKNKIDPIGLGLYARANHFGPYESVQENWGRALAEATINVTTKVILKSMGAIK